MKSSVVTPHCWPDLTEGPAVTELRDLNARGVIGSSGDKGQVVAPTTKGKVGVVTVMIAESKQQSQWFDLCRPMALAS